MTLYIKLHEEYVKYKKMKQTITLRGLPII